MQDVSREDVVESAGKTMVRPAAQAQLPWWKGATIYQVYPRSFRDTNGDGVGDLPGVTEKLDYLAALGVDAVWLSPFFPSPMRDFGYDVADYCNVDPIFGTLADFDALVEKAHRLGLKLVVDQVYSHSSDQHPWFAQSRADRANPRADWYVWAEPKPDGSPPNNWQSVFGGPAWTYDSRRRQYYLHNFLPSQPDLNVRNPAVQDALLQVAAFWLDRGVDGFRLDAINFAMHDPALTDNPPRFPPPAAPTRGFDYQQHLHNRSHPDILPFLGRLRALLDSHGAHFSVAEIGGEDPEAEMQRFTTGSDLLHSAYSFRFLTAESLRADFVRAILQQWPGAAGEGWPSWAFSNHDAPRHVTRWAAAANRERMARLSMLLLVAMRGNIFLYQGEELGLPQAEVPFERLRDPDAIANWPNTLGRDGARTPMPWRAGAPFGGFSASEPWLPFDPAHDALAVDRQFQDPQSFLHFTRFLLALRRDHPALRLGALELVDTGDADLLCFDRTLEGERIRFIANLSDRARPLDIGRNWTPIAHSAQEIYPLPIHLAPWEACLLKR